MFNSGIYIYFCVLDENILYIHITQPLLPCIYPDHPVLHSVSFVILVLSFFCLLVVAAVILCSSF